MSQRQCKRCKKYFYKLIKGVCSECRFKHKKVIRDFPRSRQRNRF